MLYPAERVPSIFTEQQIPGEVGKVGKFQVYSSNRSLLFWVGNQYAEFEKQDYQQVRILFVDAGYRKQATKRLLT